MWYGSAVKTCKQSMARARTRALEPALGLLSFTRMGVTVLRWGAMVSTDSRTSICAVDQKARLVRPGVRWWA